MFCKSTRSLIVFGTLGLLAQAAYALSVPSSDFNGDGKSDILWRQSSTGTTFMRLMNGATVISSAYLGGDSNWSALATGDFNGDGKSDILWRQSSTGATFIRLMNGAAVITSAAVGGDSTWSVVATGDFDGDGKSDLVWRHASAGSTVMWLMNGATIKSTAFIGGDGEWSVVATGDFNGDGTSDVLWRQASSGATFMRLMNGSTVVSSDYIGGDTVWRAVETGDFNGDGKTDVLWRQTSSGATFIRLMNGSTLISSSYIGGDSVWSVVGTGDFNGDGKSDVLWRQSSTGAIFMRLMNGATVTSSNNIDGSADWLTVAAVAPPPPPPGSVRLQATSFNDLVSQIRQNHPGRVPEDVLQGVLTYTAGEEQFDGYSWWTYSARRFDAIYLRVFNGQQVNQAYSNAPLVGYWKVDPPSGVPLETAVTNRLMRMRTYGTANGLNAINHETNFAWGYLPKTSEDDQSVKLVALTEGPVYDANGVLQGRALTIVEGITSLFPIPFVNGIRPPTKQISVYFFNARYRSYVLENRTGTGLLGLDVDMDVLVTPCAFQGALECAQITGN